MSSMKLRGTLESLGSFFGQTGTKPTGGGQSPPGFDWDDEKDGKPPRTFRSKGLLAKPPAYRIPKTTQKASDFDSVTEELLAENDVAPRSHPRLGTASSAASSRQEDALVQHRHSSERRTHGVWPGTPPPYTRPNLSDRQRGFKSTASPTRGRLAGNSRSIEPVLLDHEHETNQPWSSKAGGVGTKRHKLDHGREASFPLAPSRHAPEQPREFPVRSVYIGSRKLPESVLHINQSTLSARLNEGSESGEVRIDAASASAIKFNSVRITLILESAEVFRSGWRKGEGYELSWEDESYAPFDNDVRKRSVRVNLFSKDDLDELVASHPALERWTPADENPGGSSQGSHQQQAALQRARGSIQTGVGPQMQRAGRTKNGHESSQAGARFDGVRPRPTPTSTSPSCSSAAAFKQPRSSQRLKESSQARRTPTDAKVLVYPDESAKDAITLTNEELNRLERGEFLNDTLVDFYLKYLQNTMAEDDGSATLERYHFFNSFFYKRLLQTMGQARNNEEKRRQYKAVRRWTKGTDIFHKDYLFVPINESLHWSLIIIVRPGDHLANNQRREKEELQKRSDEESDRDTDVDDDSKLGEITRSPAGDQLRPQTGSDGQRADELDSDDDVHDEEVDDPAGEVWSDLGGSAEMDPQLVSSSHGCASDDEQLGSGFGSEEEGAVAQASRAGRDTASTSQAGSQLSVDVADLNHSDDDQGLMRPSEPFDGGGTGARATPIEIDESRADASGPASNAYSSDPAPLHRSPTAAATSSGVEDGAPFMRSSRKQPVAAVRAAASPSPASGVHPDPGVLRQPLTGESRVPRSLSSFDPAPTLSSPPHSRLECPERPAEEEEARAQPPHDDAPGTPTSCMLYLDSLGGSKSRAFRLLADYLYEEWAEKKGADREAARGPAQPAAALATTERSTTEEPAPESPRSVQRSSAQLQRPGLEPWSPLPLPPGQNHVFLDMPHKEVDVPGQHNHSDCGLYMLKYIELFAKNAPSLEQPLEEPRKPRWSWHKKLRFDSSDIDLMRAQMASTIETLGKAQRRK